MSRNMHSALVAARTAVRLLPAAAVALAALLLDVSGARAIKWHTCPEPPLPIYASTLGATTSPFIHPGRDLTLLLNDAEVEQTGGFSTDDEGNEVSVVFRSLFGPPVELEPLKATAVSAAVLAFTFPDVEDAGVLAGPVEVTVRADGVRVARIDAADLVGLPRANDVTAILSGEEPDRVVWAALGAAGDVWLPARAEGEAMDMPDCPGTYIAPVPVTFAAASIASVDDKGQDPLRNLRGVSVYLGDVLVHDVSMYGWLHEERLRLVNVHGTKGISICGLNDAPDLVLRVRGDASWARRESSPFADAAFGSAPVPLLLQGTTSVPAQTQHDSFGNSCPQVPGLDGR